MLFARLKYYKGRDRKRGLALLVVRAAGTHTYMRRSSDTKTWNEETRKERSSGVTGILRSGARYTRLKGHTITLVLSCHPRNKNGQENFGPVRAHTTETFSVGTSGYGEAPCVVIGGRPLSRENERCRQIVLVSRCHTIVPSRAPPESARTGSAAQQLVVRESNELDSALCLTLFTLNVD